MIRSCYFGPRGEAPSLNIPLASIARSILWLLPRDAGLLGPMQTLVNMVDTAASPCDALGTSPDRVFVSPPGDRIPKRLQTATAYMYAHLLSRLYFSARWSIHAWHLDVRGIKAARDHKHIYDSALCANAIESSSLPVTPLRPGSDIVLPAPLARGGQEDRVSVESRAAAGAAAAVAVAAQEIADAAAVSDRVAAVKAAPMQRHNDSRGSSSDSSSSSEDRYSRRHGCSKSAGSRVGSKENRAFAIGRSDHKARYDTLVPYLRGLHTKVANDGGAAEEKQKANILRFIKGERKDEVLRWEEEEPARNRIPWYGSDNDLHHSSWDSTSPKGIIHGIGLHFEAAC